MVKATVYLTPCPLCPQGKNCKGHLDRAPYVIVRDRVAFIQVSLEAPRIDRQRSSTKSDSTPELRVLS